jgi:hypothetical protein
MKGRRIEARRTQEALCCVPVGTKDAATARMKKRTATVR